MSAGPTRQTGFATRLVRTVACLLAGVVLTGCGTSSDGEGAADAPGVALTATTEGGGGQDGSDEKKDGSDEDRGDGDAQPSTSNEVRIGPALNEPGGPRIVSFGRLDVGLSRSVVLTIRNAIDETLDLSGLTITGSNASDFAIEEGGCHDGTRLEPNETCVMEVTFTPGAKGPRDALLRISVTPGGGRSLALRGNHAPTLPSDKPTFTGVEPPVQEDTPTVTEEDERVVTE